MIIFWSSALIFYFIYTGKYQFIEQWRAKDNEDDVWPWESLDLESWRKLFKRSIFFNLLNQVFLSTSFALITEYFQIYAPHSFDIKMLPSLSVFFAQIVFCCVMEDLTFYINHRILHLP
jgi:sterol desaturase/sphingolipid hydroxylase (fatty acid hydroxylase superfamily)